MYIIHVAMYSIASNYGWSRINAWPCLVTWVDNSIITMNASFNRHHLISTETFVVLTETFYST